MIETILFQPLNLQPFPISTPEERPLAGSFELLVASALLFEITRQRAMRLHVVEGQALSNLVQLPRAPTDADRR